MCFNGGWHKLSCMSQSLGLFSAEMVTYVIVVHSVFFGQGKVDALYNMMLTVSFSLIATLKNEFKTQRTVSAESLGDKKSSLRQYYDISACK